MYQKTKANHRVGSTNYATGKAFHVYRPQAIDANGAEVWAELNYDNGTLSVTVPQKFLEEAVFPVRVDPTFGYTTCGAAQESSFGYIMGSKFISPAEAGTITNLSMCGVVLSDSGTDVVRGVMYASDGSSLKDFTAALSCKEGNPPAFATGASTQSFLFSASTEYFLAGWWGSPCRKQFDSTGAGYYQAQAYHATNDPPSSITLTSYSTQRFSIYATYTADAGGASTYTGSTFIIQ